LHREEGAWTSFEGRGGGVPSRSIGLTHQTGEWAADRRGEKMEGGEWRPEGFLENIYFPHNIIHTLAV